MKKQVRIAVLVSGGGTNLQALIDATKNGIITDGKIELVVSNKPNVYALTRAKDNNIDSAVVVKKECKNQAEFEQKIKDKLSEYKIDLIVLAGFLSILSVDFVKCYPDRIINVHPSLIPAFCGDGYYGLKVHEAALNKGVKVTGATVHFVNEITDGGKILMQKAVRVMDNDTPEKLQLRVMKQAEWKILPKATQQICEKILMENK